MNGPCSACAPQVHAWIRNTRFNPQSCTSQLTARSVRMNSHERLQENPYKTPVFVGLRMSLICTSSNDRNERGLKPVVGQLEVYQLHVIFTSHAIQ